MLRATVLLLVFVLGCGGAETSPGARDAVAPPRVPSAAESLVGPEGETSVVPGDDQQYPRRIIYTANVDLVVEEFEDVPSKVVELAERFGGYVASSNVYGQRGQPRRGSWTIRVPVEHYSELLAKAGALGELRSLTSNSTDVSEEYYDVEARIRNKQKTEARLLELLEEAAGDLEQILKVEQKLDQVREEIERMQGRLRVLTDQTSLTTVTISVEQIPGYQPEAEPTYRTRVHRAFRSSVRDLVTTAADLSVMAVALSPWLAVLLVVGLMIALIVAMARRIRRRGRKEQASVDAPVSAEVVDRH